MNTLDLNARIWHDTKSAAAYSGYARKTIQRALESGELHGSQRVAGGRWRIHRDALDAWLGGGV